MTALRHVPGAGAPDRYRPPHRFPDELMDADLPDWVKVVWCAVRRVQGANDRAWAQSGHYGALCGKDAAQVRSAIAVLRRGGWLARVGRRGRTAELRCYAPALSPEARRDVEKRNEGLREGAQEVQTLIANAGETQTLIADSANPHCAERKPSLREHYKEESGQGIRSGNPNAVQQQQQQGGEDRVQNGRVPGPGTGPRSSPGPQGGPPAAPPGGDRGAPPTPTPARYPFDEGLARRLIGRGVTAPIAAELVTVVRPGRVLKELERLRRIEALGPVDRPGGLLVKYLRGPEHDLPGWDEPAAPAADPPPAGGGPA